MRVALAEADYEAAYQAAVRISPAGPQPSGRECAEERLYTGRHEVAEDLLDAVEAALHTGRLDKVDALAAEAVGLNLAEVSPRMAALAMAIAAMAAPDVQADELYRGALGHPGSVEFPFEYAKIQLAQGTWLRRIRRHTQALAVLGLAPKASIAWVRIRGPTGRAPSRVQPELQSKGFLAIPIRSALSSGASPNSPPPD